MSEDLIPTDPTAIEEAAAAMEGVVVRTPMEESRWLSAVAGGPVRLKCENLQRTGSFKIRGAYLRMSRLPAEDRARGVVAASAGNHAQGVALAAQMLGIDARVYMPEGAPIPKERATRGYGAEVVFAGHSIEEALSEAQAYAERTGATLIHPFDHPDIVAGQGTCGLEVLQQAPDVETVLVPTGGGGLVAGMATWLKQRRPDVRVVAVQAENVATLTGSLEAGAPVSVGEVRTMADGIAVHRPGDVPFRAVQQYVDDVLTVSEESLSRALVALLERAKLVVEPAGAAAVAALLDDPTAFSTPAVAVLSGGNVDPLLVGKVLQHGMAAAGRYLYLRVVLPDVPGGLAQLLGEVAAMGGNLLEVTHERLSPALQLDEVDVHLALETRGAEHSDRVSARLRELGYWLAPEPPPR